MTGALGKRALARGHSRASPPGWTSTILTVAWVSIGSCPPADVMGGHDVEHLGGLDAHQVVVIPQQGPQALQAACGGGENC